MVRKGRPIRKVAVAISPIGKWYSQIAISCVLAGVIGRASSRRPRAAALAVLASGLLGAAANHAFDWLPQPQRPPGRRRRRKSVFPSGHTTAPLSVAVVSAWVAHREGLVDGRIAVPLALLVPLVTASGKVMERKHWISDVAGGYAAGLAIACSVAALYDSEP